MQILITGVAGFVGSSLCDKLANNKKIKIIGIDDLSYGYKERMKSFLNKIEFIKKDISKLNVNDFKKFKKIDYVIHLAAITPLPDNQINPTASMISNIAGTVNLLEISRKLEIKKFIFMSSGATYERSKVKKKGFNENDKINTILMYPTSKFFGEKLCDIYNESYNLPVYKIRLFNLYGPKQDYQRKHPPFLAQVFKHIIKNEKMKIFNSNNEIKRDYLYIDDLLELILKLISYKSKQNNLTVNACSGNSFSTLEMIREVEKVTNKKLKIQNEKKASNFWGKYKDIYNGKYKLKDNVIKNEVFKIAEGDSTLFRKIINKNTTPIKKGLKECYEYAKKTIT